MVLKLLIWNKKKKTLTLTGVKHQFNGLGLITFVMVSFQLGFEESVTSR